MLYRWRTFFPETADPLILLHTPDPQITTTCLLLMSARQTNYLQQRVTGASTETAGMCAYKVKRLHSSRQVLLQIDHASQK